MKRKPVVPPLLVVHSDIGIMLVGRGHITMAEARHVARVFTERFTVTDLLDMPPVDRAVLIDAMPRESRT